MIAAPAVVAWTSRPVGRALFHIRDEREPSRVLREAEAVLRGWREDGADRRAAAAPAAVHG